MSTIVTVYSVPVDRLRAVPGSKDKKLLAARRKLKGFFEMVDEIAEDREEDEEKPPACAAAFKQLVDGTPDFDGFGYVYGYAYEGLCLSLGADAGSWTSIAGCFDWFEKIDKALAALRVKLKVMDLLYRGAVFEIPKPDEYPGLGWWTADEVADAAEVLQTLDLGNLPAKVGKTVRPVSDAIYDIRSWIDTAVGQPGDWLIGVHS